VIQKKRLIKKIRELLHHTFKPEFLNRLDGIVIFNKLTDQEVKQITLLQLENVKKQLAQHHINLEITPGMIEYFVKNGFDEVFGARPLKRLIDEKLLDEIALKMIEGSIKENETIKPIVKDNKIII
jgi:ATP-dependent Clp protease ATP-binding subunit ClpA